MRRGKDEWVHKSRMVKYNPWSDDLLDTAKGSIIKGHDIRQQQQEKEKERTEETHRRLGDEAKLGELVAIANNPDKEHKLPYVIIKITKLGLKKDAIKENDQQDYRQLEGLIYGNTTCNPKGVYRRGWIDKRNRHYFARHPEHRSHKPYTTKEYFGNELTTYSVILAGVELSTSEKMVRKDIEYLKTSKYANWGDYKGKFEDV